MIHGCVVSVGEMWAKRGWMWVVNFREVSECGCAWMSKIQEINECGCVWVS